MTASAANPSSRVAARNARVLRCTDICREHVRIEAELDGFPASAPGQFLQIQCHDSDDPAARLIEWTDMPRTGSAGGVASADETAWLRRPFSIADRRDAPDGRTQLEVISRAIGPGTRWLSKLRTGDTLNLTGPLGSGFRIAEVNRPMVLVGGGVGIPPLLYLARALAARGAADVTCIFGATTRDLLPVPLRGEPTSDSTPTPCVELPGGAPYPTLVTTDDGSIGMRGYTTQALSTWAATRAAAESTLVCACGPDGMLRAIARLTRELRMACQLCIEKPMACGLGTCLSCVTRIRDGRADGGWRWALACTEGPVFERDALLEYAS
ncbi:MAG: hypothetical protein HRU75_10070 [Planctomycetia bacterium]|nr:MAG: hypothetical protein HRU75_10070 [Planctomycetia bacterium]